MYNVRFLADVVHNPVFEDNIQEQQKKRVQKEIEEDFGPSSARHDSIDKDKDSAHHIEAVPKKMA